MTLRERQWIVNIQLNQLKCENPFLDDYYYTVFNQKRNASDQEPKNDTKTKDEEQKEVKNNLNIEEVQGDRYKYISLIRVCYISYMGHYVSNEVASNYIVNPNII